MPLVSFANRREPQNGNSGNVGKLDYRIGNGVVGQGVFLTGTTQPIAIEYGVARNTTAVAYVASMVISTVGTGSAAACILYGLSGYNSKGTAQFIHLYDAKTLPADTTGVPVVVISVPGASNFSIDFGSRGRRFANGCIVGNSSVGPTKTIGSADCWFDAQWTEVIV